MTMSQSDKEREAQQQRADGMLAQRTVRAVEQARQRAEVGDIASVSEITDRIRGLLGSDAISQKARSELQAVLRALEHRAYDRGAELALQQVFDAPKAERPALMAEFNVVLRKAIVHGAGEDPESMARSKADEVITRALREAKGAAEAGNLPKIEDIAARLRDLMSEPIVDPGKLKAYAGALKQLEEQAQQKAGDREAAQRQALAAWDAAVALAGSPDRDLRSSAVADYRKALDRAVALGAPDEFKALCLKRLGGAVANGMTEARAQATLGDVQATDYALVWLRELAAVAIIPQAKRAELMHTFKAIERDACIKATDLSLEGAFTAAHRGDDLRRNQMLGDTKRFLGRAITLGANEEFRELTEKKIASVPLTGKEKNEGPTRAKPTETAPKAYNAAKADKRNYRRYPRPVFSVRLYGHPCSTVDWSLDGMMLEGYISDLTVGQLVPIVFGLTDMPAQEAMVRIIRVDTEKTRLMVQFVNPPPKTIGFLRAVIKARTQIQQQQ